MKYYIKAVLKKFGYRLSKGDNFSGPASTDVIMDIFDAEDGITIFDVGAHHGESAKKYKLLFKNSKIYSFEPYKKSFDLIKNLNLTNFKPFNIGFSDKKDVKKFFSNKGSPTNSLLALSPQAKETWGGNDALCETEILECYFTTLDEFFNENMIESVDFLKLDVQSAEFMVLKGAHKALTEKRIHVIQLEVIIGDTYVGQKSLAYYFSLFEEYDYKLVNMSDFHFNNGELIQLDLFFKSKKFKKH